MNRQAVARELVFAARLLTAKKGEVPEAFKKQWKDKDKDNDGKENEPKPDFVKEIEKSKAKKSSVQRRRHAVARRLVTLVESIIADGA